MRTPVRTIPPGVERWVSRASWLRGLDAAAAVVAVWPLAALALDATATASAVAASMLVAAAAFVPLLRLRWRPVSALVSLSVSRALRPGDVAWCVFPGRVEHVIITARRGWRLVVARPGRESAEGVEIRRTRVLVIGGV
jgi:hypothetical protein